ncbi:hypothetical protein LWP59_00655 [Amycolatopsis acidiphila]|uniref:Uncharacterized protein n=1 Tax=Amycolatopsis acidiphila TaxID=715473 RepID=A0A558AMM5_9PSEU|nr:hypothetical protein [Amycolatopsis acidiphila]TVT25505.1 hypothetical protein FNH06_01420 [Amycolatopsis acidiphila]UIJ60245.1 hypothetical protein LWP59_00655 [Amycolatopsis acidiphila]GHG60532.1 hypothetical protein GCM10017788_14340 [Amycolatopsis acidiphila]
MADHPKPSEHGRELVRGAERADFVRCTRRRRTAHRRREFTSQRIGARRQQALAEKGVLLEQIAWWTTVSRTRRSG